MNRLIRKTAGFISFLAMLLPLISYSTPQMVVASEIQTAGVTKNKLSASVQQNELRTLSYYDTNEFLIEDGTLYSYNGTGGDVVIPDGVTSISDSDVFAEWVASFTSITFPEGIEYIELMYCDTTVLNLPSSLKSLALLNCPNITSINIPENVSSIYITECGKASTINIAEGNPYLFTNSGCVYTRDDQTLIFCPPDITELNVYEGTKSIMSSALSGNYYVTKVVIPEGCENINKYAFSNCYKLKSITLPSSLKNIYQYAFRGCSSLTDIALPEGLELIDYYAFNGCSSLTSIKLPSSLTTFEDLGKCSSLTKIEVAEGNVNLKSYDGCLYNSDYSKMLFYPSAKKKVEFHKNCKDIGSNVFMYSDIEEIKIPKGVTVLYDEAFSYCYNLKKVVLSDTVKTISYNAFDHCTNLTDIKLNDSLETIGSRAFAYCSSLTNITIPKGVTDIQSYPFYGCKNLVKIDVAKKCTKYASYDGSLYSKDLTTLIYCPIGKTEHAINDKTNTIKFSALSTQYLTSNRIISIPESVETIDSDNVIRGDRTNVFRLYAGSAAAEYFDEWNCSFELIDTDKEMLNKVTVKSIKLKKGKTAAANLVIPAGVKPVTAFGESNNEFKIKFASKNKNIATVSKSGVITGKKAGKAVINATLTTKAGVKRVLKINVTVK